MTHKLISMNIGMILEFEVNGQEHKKQLSVSYPSESFDDIPEVLESLEQFLKENLSNWHLDTVKVARPKKIKANRPLSQIIFNRKRKELGYEE